MGIKIAINGFGRIGRLVFRVASQHDDIDVVAINDIASPENLTYLLKFDSVHRNFPGKVSLEGDSLVVNGKKTLILSERNPENLPWGKLDVDYVVESTGLFTTREKAEMHLKAGAKKVLLSAPGKGDRISTFVMGVNHTEYDPKADIISSNASCTTNCLAPVVKVLLDNFGIEEGLVTTIHALTVSQPSVDSPSKRDFRIGRNALANIIPASTGAAAAVAKCIPEIKGKLTAMAFRVPVTDVSVVDLTVRLEKETSYNEICNAMKKASEGEMKGFLHYCEDPAVSSDFIGSPYSSIFDKNSGIALNSKFYKLIAWYDNEMGYSNRMIDLVKYMASVEK